MKNNFKILTIGFIILSLLILIFFHKNLNKTLKTLSKESTTLLYNKFLKERIALYYLEKINWKVALIKVENDLFDKKFNVKDLTILNPISDSSDYDPFIYEYDDLSNELSYLYEKCGFFKENLNLYDCSIFLANQNLSNNDFDEKIYYDQKNKISFSFNTTLNGKKYYLIEDFSSLGIKIYSEGYKSVITQVTDEGNYFDPILFYKDDYYFIFATDTEGYLRVFFSEDLEKNLWEETKYSKKIKDQNFNRNAGRIFIYKGRIIRPTMKNDYTYGEKIILNEIKFDINEIIISEEKILELKFFDNHVKSHHIEHVPQISNENFDYFLIDIGLKEKFRLNSVKFKELDIQW